MKLLSLLIVPSLLAVACAKGDGPEVQAAPEAPSAPRASLLETVAEVAVPPGNVALAPDGTVYFTVHQFFAPEYPVAELHEGAAQAALADVELVSPLGIAIDGAGTVWLLDNGLAAEDAPPRLVARAANQVTRAYDLSDASRDDSFVNDLVIDLEHRTAYIADPAGGKNAALIVLNLRDGSARRVLEGHESVVPEDIDLVIGGEPVTLGSGEEVTRPRIGVNPIAIDAAGEWLYFGPMHGTSMYRVRAADLRDPSLSKKALTKRVERYSDKPICDGITIDADGNIYLGDLANDAIGVIDANGAYRVLESSPKLSWVDAFAIGPDGKIYTVANQLHLSPPLRRGTDASTPPYQVLRFEPVGPPTSAKSAPAVDAGES